MDEPRRDEQARERSGTEPELERGFGAPAVPAVAEPPVVETVPGGALVVDGDDLPELETPRIPPPPYFGRHYQPEPGEDVEIVDPGAAITSSEDDTGIVGQLISVAEPVVNAVEPIVESIVVPVAEAIGSAIDHATSAFGVRDAITDAISERLSHRNPEPLPNLYDVHPEARLAAPRELGFRFVPIEDIRGTAVAGIAQRGTDFLPLPPFRGSNWTSRWQRIKEARDQLKVLPPLDLIKYGGEYWVVDGHNRVAATIDGKGVGVDAMVVELVPLDGQTSERPSNVLAFLDEATALRNAVQGRRPANEREIIPTMPLPDIEPGKPVGHVDGEGRAE
jgi:hypothetical protein